MSVLTLTSVVKRYGAVTALDGVDLHVEPGEVVALLGPNGSGKTTVFEVLLGLTRPDGGSVTVLGGPPAPAVRRRTGVMLQSAGLLEHVTVRELVRLVGRSYPTATTVAEVLDRTAMADRARAMVTDLSGGERQRLQLAMAMVGRPELLLLDEPTSALDVASRDMFWEHVRVSAAEGVAVLFATHDLADAATAADRVVVLRRGRVAGTGTLDELTEGGRRDLRELVIGANER